jgi:outer membrane receptor protein involved in Fe transport
MNMKMARSVATKPALAVGLLLLTASWTGPAWAQKSALGIVRGVVQTTKGRAVGGFWLMLDNPDLGMNYRMDVNPIGRFEFKDIFPGPYVFRISPYSYTVVSPAQIQVKAGQSLTVTVVVTPAPNPPAAPTPPAAGSGENGLLTPGVRIIVVAQNAVAQNAVAQNSSTPPAGQPAQRTQSSSSASGARAGTAGQRSGEGSEPPAAVQLTVGSGISESQLVGLPLNGRSYNQLATLQAGVSDPLGGSATRGGGSGSLTVSGGRSSSNTFLMDGSNIMDTGNQVPRSAAGVQLGSDTVMEVQVNGVQYSAEYGHGSGGVLNSITRSGTDQFHANLFEFFRNSHMDARNFFDRQLSPTDPRLPPFKRNQFGFTLTGPIRAKRTYWMAGMEVMRDRLTSTDTSNVLDKSATSDVQVDTRILPYLALYPPVNGEHRGTGFGVHSEAIFIPTNETFFTGRIDHRISDRDSIFGRYNFDDAESFSIQNVAYFRTIAESRQQYLSLVASHIFGPHMIASGRLGYTRPVARRDTVTSPDVRLPRSLYFVPTASQLGVMQIPGSSAFGPSASLPDADIMNTFQFAGDLILQRGTHNMKLGVDVQRYRSDVFQSLNQGAVWSFTSRVNFLTLERDKAGLPGTTTLSVALPGSDASKAYRQTLLGFYFQDQYRIAPRLQLNLGMRYEFTTLIHDRDGRTAHLADPLHDTSMTVGPLLDHNPSLRNFSPRIGLSWAPTGKASTVVDAGLGVYYDHILEYVADSRGLSPPFYNTASIINLNPFNYFPDALAAAAAQPGNKIQALILDYQNMSSPMVLRYNAAIRQQLPLNWRATFSYVGARGNHLYRAYEINQFSVPIRQNDGTYFFPPGTVGINPAFGSVNLLSSDAQSFYNALQITASRTFGRGTTVNANYTFSKSIDDTSNFGTTNESIQYGLMRSLDRAISDFNIRHRLTTSFFYAVPFGAQGAWLKSGLGAHLLGGWRLGGILSDRSGTPINLRMNVRNSNTLFAANRPNLRPGYTGSPKTGVTTACDPRIQSNFPIGAPVGLPERYYDPCAFDVPPEGTIGNNGRNTLKGPGSFSLDVSLQREFLLDSKRRIQFRGEAFNLTNRVNFRPFSAGSAIVFTGSAANPSVNGTAGSIVSTSSGARQLQFALRLSF